ncbi:MAG: isocitrate/isopropylmalate dehydrogenase family protein [Ignavibacteriales bacterium]
MDFRIAIVPGDGIGPEVMDVTLDVLKAAAAREKGLRFEFITRNIGYELWLQTGDHIVIDGIKYGGISEEALRVYDGTDAMLYVATSGGSFPREYLTPFPVVRRHFNVFANVRPARELPNVFSLKPGINLVLVREQTEGMWMGNEYGTPNVESHAVARVTRNATARVSRFAFSLARTRNRLKKVTCVHKSNVLPHTFGLFVDVCAEVSKEFPDCVFEEMHTDVLPYELINSPESLDVILTTNMYGDAISGEVAGICGGLGIAPSGEYGEKYAIFRPVHGSAPDIKGKGIANPIATIRSAAMMLQWLGSTRGDAGAGAAGLRIEQAVERVTGEAATLTPDLGGGATSREVGEAVVVAMNAGE